MPILIRSKNGFHYRFKVKGKRFTGKCLNCKTLNEAKAYEENLKAQIKLSTGDKIDRSVIGIISQNTGKDAYKVAKAVKTAVDDIMNDIIPISIAYAKYRESKLNTIAGKQLTTYRTRYNVFSKWAQDMKLENIDEVNIEIANDYVKFINEQFSSKTVHHYISLLNSTWNYFFTLGKVKSNPWKSIRISNTKISREIFSEEEIKKIEDNLNDLEIKPLFVLGMYTGLTLSDICTLKWDQIKNGFIRRKRLKTGAQLDIPILSKVKKLIDEMPKTDVYVFPRLHKIHKSTQLHKLVNNFLDSIGIEHARENSKGRMQSIKGIHSLRHTFAYFAGKYGVPQVIVQSVLGHMTKEMTEMYQMHATREDKIKYLSQIRFSETDISKKDRVLSKLSKCTEKQIELILNYMDSIGI